MCKSLQGNATIVAHKLCGGNRNTGTTAKRSQRGAAVATIGVQVLIAQPTDCCCCQVSHTTDLSYTQLNIKPGTRLIWGWLSRGMGLIYSPLLTVGTKDTTADVTDVTDVTDPTVSFDQLKKLLCSYTLLYTTQRNSPVAAFNCVDCYFLLMFKTAQDPSRCRTLCCNK